MQKGCIILWNRGDGDFDSFLKSESWSVLFKESNHNLWIVGTVP